MEVLITLITFISNVPLLRLTTNYYRIVLKNVNFMHLPCFCTPAERMHLRVSCHFYKSGVITIYNNNNRGVTMAGVLSVNHWRCSASKISFVHLM